MAKKKSNTSAYTKARSNVLRLQRQINKLGGSYDTRHLLTENEQRKKGRSGSELTKATNQMKKLERELKEKYKNRKYYLSKENIADEVSDIYQQEENLSRLQETQEYEQGLYDYLIEDSYYPTGSDIALGVTEEIVNEVTDDIPESDYTKYYNDFANEAYEDLPPLNQYGRRWSDAVYRQKIRSLITIRTLLMDSVTTDGENATGWKIFNSNAMEYLDAIFRDSNQQGIEQATRGLENILANHVLTQQEREEIEESSDVSDSYDVYGV